MKNESQPRGLQHLATAPKPTRAARRPGPRGERERRLGQLVSGPFAKLDLLLGVQLLEVSAGRPHAQCEGIPPFLEGRVVDVNRQHRLLDLTQSRFVEELRELTFARPGKVAFAFLVRVELAHGLPEGRKRRLMSSVIQDARRDHATCAGDSTHLGQPLHGIRHEVHDELRKSCVEYPVGERQRLSRRLLNVDTGMTFARSRDERLRRIDGRDVRRAYTLY